MAKIKMMLNGLPGNVSATIAAHAVADPRVELLPYSFTGPEIEQDQMGVCDLSIQLIRPDARNRAISSLKQKEGPFISVDFTHPGAVNENARFYCDHGLPFVMGTTGGDREALFETVCQSALSAVIAPNMAKQIVGFQAMMEYAAKTFPGLFKGYRLTVCESHQKGKADTSGTARAMVGYFNQMGVPFRPDQIEQVRDPEIQRDQWHIPQEYLDGHGWHTYTLVSQDQTVTFQFTHNVNGREIYADGTLDAVVFLASQVARGSRGEVFSMIDVLKG
jgi:4-hydroxy-tetrahydrodipicolinate reductase